MTTAVNTDQITEITNRFLKLYTGAISDILDKNGYRRQVLPSGIMPFTAAKRVAGPAFTIQGYSTAGPGHEDTQKRLKTLDSAVPGTVTVLASNGSVDCAHWGEIMSTAVRQRGSTGAVIDGGVRDVDFLNAMKFPVFARFKCCASLAGRWEIVDSQVAVKIGDTAIYPGDFVLGDIDGVVVVPKDITMDVLAAAEDIEKRECGMREELRRGTSVLEAFAKYGSM